MESNWTRAFNSFGFIALLVCLAVLLTAISSSLADQHEHIPPQALLPEAGLMLEIQASLPAAVPGRD